MVVEVVSGWITGVAVRQLSDGCRVAVACLRGTCGVIILWDGCRVAAGRLSNLWDGYLSRGVATLYGMVGWFSLILFSDGRLVAAGWLSDNRRVGVAW